MTRHAPSYLHEYHCKLVASSFVDNLSPSTSHPISHHLFYNHLFPSHKSYALSLSLIHELKTYKKVVVSLYWQAVIQSELETLKSNETWSITSLPASKKAIGCKYVFKMKLKSDGSIDKHKFRLVAKGYTQREGFNYQETFKMVAKLTTISLFFTLAAIFNWNLDQLNVHNAFLHGDLDDENYMEFFPSFHITNNGIGHIIKHISM